MVGRISISVPFRYNIAGLTFFVNRRAGFSFTNHATLILANNLNKTIDEVNEWARQNRTLFINEMFYAAYVAWCQENYTRPVFSKTKIAQGFLRLDLEDQNKIMKVWTDSTTFGAKSMPGAKKKQQPKPRG